ncbi:hypothetical protein [Streptomyces longwoodensis]|uniref:hypothetical protein n=1 Tax=Streptomyces longwoodensis TaxID=68231 RepID=UPI00384D95DB
MANELSTLIGVVLGAVLSYLAAHQGLTEDPTPVEPTNDALEQAAQAETKRAAMTEPLRLLADPTTAAAVRSLNDAVWHLEWMARGRLTGDAAAWDQAYREYRTARQTFYDKARASLQVPGGVIAERASCPRPGGRVAEVPPRACRSDQSGRANGALSPTRACQSLRCRNDPNVAP